MVMQGGETN